jgi:predicted PurR-regulated permease PerM
LTRVHLLFGIGVLVLLSVFFAYVVAPLVAALRLRVRTGQRQRPPSNAVAILIVYVVLFLPAALVWRNFSSDVTHWVHVTAPESVELLFGGRTTAPIERVVARTPLPDSWKPAVVRQTDRFAVYLERQTRGTLSDLIDAADYAAWLLVAPVLAFILLAGRPRFQRSTLRVLPRGHLQWRMEEYLHDVNSALAGYVRAQAASAVIVGTACVSGFLLLGVESAVSMGVAAGVLELVPALGPFTALLMAGAHAGNRLLEVIVFLAALRIVQDYVIYPWLIRQGLHLSKTAVILTIWFGGALAGAAGVILAIPAAGFLTVSVRHWREYRAVEDLVRPDGRGWR